MMFGGQLHVSTSQRDPFDDTFILLYQLVYQEMFTCVIFPFTVLP